MSRIFHMDKMQPFFLQCTYRSLIRGSIHDQVILTISEKFFRNCIKIMNQEKIIRFLKILLVFKKMSSSFGKISFNFVEIPFIFVVISSISSISPFLPPYFQSLHQPLFPKFKPLLFRIKQILIFVDIFPQVLRKRLIYFHLDHLGIPAENIRMIPDILSHL